MPTDSSIAERPMHGWDTWIIASVRRYGWAPMLVMGTHLVASKLTRLYAAWPGLDIPMHFLGGASIGWFFWRAVSSAEGRSVLGSQSTSGRAVTTLGLVGTATVVWEFAEWTTDRLGITRAQASLDDTMLDMAIGLAGGLLVTGVACMRSGGHATDHPA